MNTTSKKLLHLGEFFVNNFVVKQSDTAKKYSLDLYTDPKNNAVRLHNELLAPADDLWNRYWYRSGTNTTMKKELNSIVNEITERIQLDSGDVWLDVGCNDGTLLSCVPSYVTRIGIDPADDSFYQESSKVATVVQEFFNQSAFTSVSNKPAKVITCIAMFYDLNDPDLFVKDLYSVLDNDGVVVMQLSYTPLMIKQLAFDNICHEHIYYWGLEGITQLFARHNFRLVDANLNDTNGGSIRVYFQKATANTDSFATPQLRNIFDYKINSLLEYEQKHYNLEDTELWNKFKQDIDSLGKQLISFVQQAKRDGKTIWAYGASTKGNTLLQYFNLTELDIDAVAERNPLKHGLRTIGTNIPIRSEEEMRSAQPDYLLILPWHFINEFTVREADYLNKGGAFIVPCPEFKIITKEQVRKDLS